MNRSSCIISFVSLWFMTLIYGLIYGGSCQRWLTGCHMSNVYLVRFMSWFMVIWPVCHSDCHVTGVLSPLIDMMEVCVNQKIKQMSDLTFDVFITGFMMVLSLTWAVGVFYGVPSWPVTHFQSLGSSWKKMAEQSECIDTLTGSMFVWSIWYMLIPVWLPTGLHLALSKEVVWASGFRVCVLGQHLWWIGF